MNSISQNIIIAGVGGQGTILASKIISQAAGKEGLFVRTSETIGMAQRGGSVSSHVRINAKGVSPVIPMAHGDILIGFELAEAARQLPRLRKNARCVINTDTIVPINAALKKGKYLENEYLEVLKKNLTEAVFIKASPIAKQAGDARTLNVVMLGVASGAGILPFSEDDIKNAIRESVKPKLFDINMRAFELGVSAVKEAQTK